MEKIEKKGYFETFLSSSFSKKKLLLSLSILFSISGTLQIGVPLLFKDPIIYCINEKNIKYECLEEELCNTNNKFEIDIENGSKSLTSYHSLICQKSSEKRMAITLNFIGCFLGEILLTFFLVSPAKRKNAICLAGFLLGCCFSLMIVFQDYFYLISILMCFGNIFSIYINTYSYMYSNENFKGIVVGLSIFLFCFIWALFGICLAIISYFTMAEWKFFAAFCGFIAFFGTFSFFFSINEDKLNPEDLSEHVSLISYFNDLLPNKQIRNNFLIYNLVFTVYQFTYNGLYVELESVGGNLYFNMCFSCILEMSAAFIGGYLTKNYSCPKIMKCILSGLFIFFIIFIFGPSSLKSKSFKEVIFFILSMLICKMLNDNLFLIIYLYLPKVMTDKYVNFFIVFSRFFSRFWSLFIPTISYLVRLYGIHPFVFYGIMWLICLLLLTFTKEVQSEGIDDLLNELNVGFADRLSILSGSHSLSVGIFHNDILKNVKVEGVELSLIRKYKQNSDSINANINSPLINSKCEIKSPLLRKILMNSKNGKLSYTEMKENIKNEKEKL